MKNSAMTTGAHAPAGSEGRTVRRARWLLGSMAVAGLLVGAAIPAVSMVSSQAGQTKLPPIIAIPQGVRLHS